MQTSSTTGADDRGFFGHPLGLRTLFFTEMWERFSYYGMRALLILFMTAAVADGGLGFGADKAGPIYAMYTSLVYLTAVPGGWLADNFLGQRKAVFYGGIVIMVGHIMLAMHGLPNFYGGLACVVVGTGLLKPNISVVVGQLYTPDDRRRDSGFSIFYMGINLGAFSAPLICGYLAQSDSWKARLDSWGMDPNSSWHWGFGAAAVGMFFGLVQYVLTSKCLGTAGLSPSKPASPEDAARNKRVLVGGLGAVVVAILGLLWVDSRATYFDTVRWAPTEGGLLVEASAVDDSENIHEFGDSQAVAAGDLGDALGTDASAAVFAHILATEVEGGTAAGSLEEVYVRLSREDLIAGLKDVELLDGETLPTAEGPAEDTEAALRIRDVTWSSAGGVLRVVGQPAEPETGTYLLAVLPASDLEGGISGALAPLGKALGGDVASQAISTGRTTGELKGVTIKVGGLNTKNIRNGFMVLLLGTVVIFFGRLFTMGHWTRNERARLTTIFVLFCGAAVFWGIFEQAGSTLSLFADRSTNNSIFGFSFPSSWWQSVNAVMIIALAPFFAWLWLKLGRRDPSYPAKFAIGITFAALGFAVLVGGATLAKSGALVSPMWLLAVYLLHTIGELCLSPVGLSSMTKLAPARVVSLMMGVWFLATGVGNFLGGSVAGYYEDFELPDLFGYVAASGGIMAFVMFLLVIPMKRMLARSGPDAVEHAHGAETPEGYEPEQRR